VDRIPKLVAAAVAGACILAGCSGARIIEPPDGQATNPVRQFSVQFHPNFVPGSFRANLDGNDITSLFSPTPAPGGTSVANWDVPFDIGVSATAGAEHRLDVNSSVNPQIGFTLQDQRLVANFAAPHLQINVNGAPPPNRVIIPTNQTVGADVCLVPTPTAPVLPLSVGVFQGPGAPLRLNGAPDGQEVFLSLGPGTNPTQTCAPLTIQTQQTPGNFELNATAVGVQRGVIAGEVIVR